MHRPFRGNLASTALAIALLLAVPVAVAAEENTRSPATVTSPLSPAEAMRRFQLAPGLRLELVAAEPDVIDPVAIAFDEDGRLWVVEMIDYPTAPAAGEPPLSRLRVLEDRDGDGRYETSRVFVDKLLFPTGVQPWKGGAVVTLAGSVMYFRDTTGDGRADLAETWFTGFAQKNEQLRANHPRLALDNRIYIANGLRGGTVVARPSDRAADPQPVDISGMDFRFDPLSGDYEAVSGVGQFGLTFDDFGNRFVCSNRNPNKHIVLANRYLARNAFLAVPAVSHDVSPEGESSRVFPLSRNWTNSTEHSGQFTAACGVLIYRGTGLPEPFRSCSFTCEPTGNLVHRDVLSPLGATFSSRPGRRGAEFLATPDNWFRPVNLAGGPDGALYIVDMYRAVVEHPQWLPDDVVRRLPMRAGDDRGRIYRVVAAEKKPAPRRPRLSGARTAELVSLLADRDAWWRETAARLIYERQDDSAAPALEEMALRGPHAVARVHALWALNGLGALSQQTVLAALDDPHGRVREQAVRLGEAWLASSDVLRKKVVQLADDADARVRFQVALSLGEVGDRPVRLDALKKIALRDAADRWTRMAVVSSLPDGSGELLKRVLDERHGATFADTADVRELAALLAETVGSRRDEAEVAGVLRAVVAAADTSEKDNPRAWPAPLEMTVLGGLGRGIVRRGDSLDELLARLPAQQQDVKHKLRSMFLQAAHLAADDTQPTPPRRQALDVLRHAGFDIAGAALLVLAQSEPVQLLRVAAIDVLATYDDASIGPVLLDDYRSQTPRVRRAVLAAMLADRDRIRGLLRAIESGQIRSIGLDRLHVDRLIDHQDPAIRAEARRLLADAVPADRKKVLAEYRAALSLAGDAARGRVVFERQCATCHKIGDLGVDVAPSIADSLRKTPEALLESILNPSRAVDGNYVSYTIVTVDGQVQSGIIAQESATSVTLRQAENKTVTVLRQDIELIRSDGVSLMPDGLEKNITLQQMSDLISFIKNWQFIQGRIPVRQDGRGG